MIETAVNYNIEVTFLLGKWPPLIHELLCQILLRQRVLVYFLQLIYEVLNLYWSWFLVHRTYTEGKLHKRR